MKKIIVFVLFLLSSVFSYSKPINKSDLLNISIGDKESDLIKTFKKKKIKYEKYDGAGGRSYYEVKSRISIFDTPVKSISYGVDSNTTVSSIHIECFESASMFERKFKRVLDDSNCGDSDIDKNELSLYFDDCTAIFNTAERTIIIINFIHECEE